MPREAQSDLSGGCGKYHVGCHVGAKHTPLLPDALRYRDASCVHQFPYLANTRDLFGTENLNEIMQVLFQVFERFTLCPMIWVVVEITQVTAFGFFPICKSCFRIDIFSFSLYVSKPTVGTFSDDLSYWRRFALGNRLWLGLDLFSPVSLGPEVSEHLAATLIQFLQRLFGISFEELNLLVTQLDCSSIMDCSDTDFVGESPAPIPANIIGDCRLEEGHSVFIHDLVFDSFLPQHTNK